jgi:uncharacterized membrane protein (DUF2068 family)
VAGDGKLTRLLKSANLRLASRALAAVALAALATAVVRLRGSRGVPPHAGGWRELPLEAGSGSEEPGTKA